MPAPLTADFGRDHDKAIASTTYFRWTHVALIPLNTDIRDGYNASPTSLGLVIANQDWVWVPDKTKTKFAVIFVERINRGTTQECLRAYLQRQAPAWPTQKL